MHYEGSGEKTCSCVELQKKLRIFCEGQSMKWIGRFAWEGQKKTQLKKILLKILRGKKVAGKKQLRQISNPKQITKSDIKSSYECKASEKITDPLKQVYSHFNVIDILMGLLSKICKVLGEIHRRILLLFVFFSTS